jgi:hypothetical protein
MSICSPRVCKPRWNQQNRCGAGRRNSPSNVTKAKTAASDFRSKVCDLKTRMQSKAHLVLKVRGPSQQPAWLAATYDWLDQAGGRVESVLSGRPWLSLVGLAAAFLTCASLTARHLPFVFDEILTRYICAQPGFNAIWNALMAHAEASPPLFHLISRMSGLLFGFTPLGLRLPAIAGFLAMMLCVYLTLQRYTGPLYAAIGVLATYLTVGPLASVAARPYGLLLGFSSIALVCWQQAARNHKRALALAGLCLSLAAAIGVHFYAAVSFFGIGCGELVRTWRTRRIDWMIWLAVGLGTAPLFLVRPLIHANLVFVQGFFAPATLANFVEATADAFLPMRGILCVGFLLLACVCTLLIGRREAPVSSDLEKPPIHEMAAWLALLLAPVEVFVAGRLLTGAFTARYGIVTLIGLSILLPLGLQRLFRNSRAAALAVLLFLVVCFAGWYALGLRKHDSTASLVSWLRASNPSHLPIVVADFNMYLPLAYRVPDDVAATLVYIPDASEALKYTGVNSAEHSLAAMRSLAPLNLPSYSSFTESHQSFLILWQESRFDWVVPKLRDAGAELRIYDQSDAQVLFLVNLHPAGGLPPNGVNR